MTLKHFARTFVMYFGNLMRIDACSDILWKKVVMQVNICQF